MTRWTYDLSVRQEVGRKSTTKCKRNTDIHVSSGIRTHVRSVGTTRPL
jgi:hypothetical protein